MEFLINGEWWAIVPVHPTDPVLLRPDGVLSVGACNDITKSIYLSSDLSGDFLKKVLCHEIVHAAMFSYDVTLDWDEEELVAEIIATFGEEIIYKTNVLFHFIKGRY
jgi:hypothetical protein